MFFLILCFFVAIILLLIAPIGYSNTYNLICLSVFLLSSIFFLRKQVIRQGWLNFHLPFVVSFFFTSIVYPVFLYPVDPEYFFIFAFGYNYDLISKSLAISLIAIISYYISVYLFSSKISFSLSKISFSPNEPKLVLPLTILAFILYMLQIGVSSFFSGYSEVLNSMKDNSLISPLLSILTCLLFMLISYKIVEYEQQYKSFKSFAKSNMLPLILILTIIILYLIGGSRTLVIQLGLTIVCLYSLYIKRISGKVFLVFFLCAFFVLGMTSRIRKESSSDGKKDAVKGFLEDSRPIDFAMDFVIVNRNLYMAVDEVEKNGFSYGMKTSKSLFAFFPYYPAFMKNVFELEPKEIDAEIYFSEETNVNFSVGNHLVGDLYMILGIPAVILGMMLLGWFVCLCERNASKSIYWFYVYTVLLSASVLYPRFSIFFLSRNIIWGLIMIKCISLVAGRQKNSVPSTTDKVSIESIENE